MVVSRNVVNDLVSLFLGNCNLWGRFPYHGLAKFLAHGPGQISCLPLVKFLYHGSGSLISLAGFMGRSSSARLSVRDESEAVGGGFVATLGAAAALGDDHTFLCEIPEGAEECGLAEPRAVIESVSVALHDASEHLAQR